MNVRLFLLILIAVFSSCNESHFEDAAVDILIEAERNVYHYDTCPDTLLCKFKKLTPLSSRDNYIQSLVRYRLDFIDDLNEDSLLYLAKYFQSEKDSLFASIAYTRLGNYILRKHNDLILSMQYMKTGNLLCPKSCPIVYAHNLYSLSQIYYTHYPDTKKKHLTEALQFFEKDSNYMYMAYCFCDLMSCSNDIDTAMYYAEKLRNNSLYDKIDYKSKCRFDFAYAKRFVKIFDRTKLLQLALPAYRFENSTDYAIFIAQQYILNNQLDSADIYINATKDIPNLSSNYYFLNACKSVMLNDYEKALIYNNVKDSIVYYSIYKLYANNLNLIEEDIESDNSIKLRELAQVKMERTVFVLIIGLLLVFTLILLLYIYYQKKTDRLKSQKQNVEQEMLRANTEYNKFKGKAIKFIKENFLSYKKQTDSNIIERIDAIADGLASSMMKEYPQLKRKDVIILFMRYIGCTNLEISDFLGYAGTASIHHRTSALKKVVGIDYSVDLWMEKMVERLAPIFAKQRFEP